MKISSFFAKKKFRYRFLIIAGFSGLRPRHFGHHPDLGAGFPRKIRKEVEKIFLFLKSGKENPDFPPDPNLPGPPFARSLRPGRVPVLLEEVPAAAEQGGADPAQEAAVFQLRVDGQDGPEKRRLFVPKLWTVRALFWRLPAKQEAALNVMISFLFFSGATRRNPKY